VFVETKNIQAKQTDCFAQYDKTICLIIKIQFIVTEKQ
jgi:hypothetical protein